MPALTPLAARPPFFVKDGAWLVATEHTRGPWSKDHQHGGPPCALLARAAEELLPSMEVARVSCELLKPVPIGRVRVEAEVEKPGRKAAVVRARLLASTAGGDVTCMDARLGCVRVAEVGAATLVHAPAPAAPASCEPFSFSFFPWEVGYHTAFEGRLGRGVFGRGSMGMWMRQLGALVEGEEPSPAQRVLVVADAGSGVSLGLDPRRFSFVNADLSVHMHRAARGAWIMLDASTWTTGNGRGMADTAILDVDGLLGRAAQTLIVEARA